MRRAEVAGTLFQTLFHAGSHALHLLDGAAGQLRVRARDAQALQILDDARLELVSARAHPLCTGGRRRLVPRGYAIGRLSQALFHARSHALHLLAGAAGQLRVRAGDAVALQSLDDA